METSFWRNCSSCKSEIGYEQNYYLCSVSTCRQRSTGYVFCSVPCFERHLPAARHKDAWAEHETAPSRAAVVAARQNENAAGGGQRRIISSQPRATGPSGSSQQLQNDILVVASKLKAYIKANYDYNTANDVMAKLSDMIRIECDKAADHARADGRKTVMARDFR